MKRCKKCLMPLSIGESDSCHSEQCQWCTENFPNYRPKGDESLRNVLNTYRNKSNSADCLVALSGGKDSTYTLIKLKTKYDMRVEAFTYVHEGTASCFKI